MPAMSDQENDQQAAGPAPRRGGRRRGPALARVAEEEPAKEEGSQPDDAVEQEPVQEEPAIWSPGAAAMADARRQGPSSAGSLLKTSPGGHMAISPDALASACG